MTFLISEDVALRDLCKGITVSDEKNDMRPVGVWFGQPDMEIRAQAYPYITVNMIDISEARERQMSGVTNVWYLRPEGVEDDHWDTWNPIPVNIDYQITTFARNPRHDRELLFHLLSVKLPLRFGSLATDDGTLRRLDVLDVAKRDVIEAGKRLFMNIFTVRVSSEIPTPFYFFRYAQVNSVEMDLGVWEGPFVYDRSDEPVNDEVNITINETLSPDVDPSVVAQVTIEPSDETP